MSAPTGGPARRPFPSSTALVGRQIRYQLLLFRRVPVAMFFTLGLPLLVLVLFNALFGDNTVMTGAGVTGGPVTDANAPGGGEWPARQFYTAGLAVFTAVTATYTNLANMVPIRRDEGVLKRWRGTPLPTWTYVAGAIGSAVIIAAVGALVMLGLGVVAYDVQVEAAKVPAAVVTFVVGVASFAALGMAVAAVVPSASSASAVANATILPLAFVSNVFIALEDPPRWLALVGDVFPLKPFVTSFQDAFNPTVAAPAFNWPALGFVALWGAFGAAVAVRRFRWEPAPGGTTRRRRASQRATASAD